jgi:Anti-sigma factor NepR
MVDDKKKLNKAPIVQEKNERMIKTSAKPQVSDLIGQRLRNYYQEVASEPIPDRFMDLLNQLDAASAKKKSE